MSTEMRKHNEGRHADEDKTRETDRQTDRQTLRGACLYSSSGILLFGIRRLLSKTSNNSRRRCTGPFPRWSLGSEASSGRFV